MTSARLSPAANLLRNSKLFALPPQIALPAALPSSEPLPSSDTATTRYPIRAAIETPQTSSLHGDWGLKRTLPLRSTTKSGTPVIRIQNGIDTIEHITDFESAADHVVNLRKWQDLHMQIKHPSESYDGRPLNVFRPTADNTTNTTQGRLAPSTGIWPDLNPEQKRLATPEKIRQAQTAAEEEREKTNPQQPPSQRTESSVVNSRWRYAGPWLAGISGMEFESYLKKIATTKKSEFKEVVRAHMVAEKQRRQRAEAINQGEYETESSENSTIPILEISDEELVRYIRTLRSEPSKLGPIIASFLDLPEGPGTGQKWTYGRQTLAARRYSETGPPRTHPSAGLSYLRSDRYARNHSMYGPQTQPQPVPARVIKVRQANNLSKPAVGVAGFVAVPPAGKGRDGWQSFAPREGGHKEPVVPQSAYIDSQGSVNLSVNATMDWYMTKEDKVIHGSEARRELGKVEGTDAASSGNTSVPKLDRGYKVRENVKADPEVDNMLDEMMKGVQARQASTRE